MGVNKIIKLPYGIVDMAISQGWTKQLAYYSHIAMLHGNRVIYNYTSRKLAAKLNKSHGTVNTHVSFLLSIGMLKMRGKHLVCADIKDMQRMVVLESGRETGSGLLKIKVHNKVLNTEWNIKARVVLNSINQQEYKYRLKSEVNAIAKKISNNDPSLKKSEYDFYNRYRDLGLIGSEKDTDKIFLLSDATIGFRLGNKSVTHVRTMMSFWASEGLVESTFIKGRVLDTHKTAKEYYALKSYSTGYNKTFHYKGRIMEYNKRAVSFGSAINSISGIGKGLVAGNLR